MAFRTTSASGEYRPKPTLARVGNHLIVHSAIEDFDLTDCADILLVGPPALDPDWSVTDFENWLTGNIIPKLNTIAKKDAVLIQICSDRKGGTWMKSIASAALFQRFGWDIFRQVIWERQDADFHRSKYAFNNIYFFRRGNRTTNAQSPLRYKDIIRVKGTPQASDGVWPEEVIELCLSLFIKQGDVVIDPFAGVGTATLVCEKLGFHSISVELDQANFRQILKSLEGVIRK